MVWSEALPCSKHLRAPRMSLSFQPFAFLVSKARVQSENAPNYWEAAWNARRFVEEGARRQLPRDKIGMAVNSAASRSQDQLHIHVACIAPKVADFLRRHQAEIYRAWSFLSSPQCRSNKGAPGRDPLSEGFRDFVTSMPAPVASGWSGRRVGLAPTGKRHLFFHGAHPKRTLQLRSFRVRLVEGTGVQDRSRRSHRRVNSAAWSFTKSAMLVGVSPVSLR